MYNTIYYYNNLGFYNMAQKQKRYNERNNNIKQREYLLRAAK